MLRFSKEFHEELLSELKAWVTVLQVVTDDYSAECVPEDIQKLWQQIATTGSKGAKLVQQLLGDGSKQP